MRMAANTAASAFVSSGCPPNIEWPDHICSVLQCSLHIPYTGLALERILCCFDTFLLLEACVFLAGGRICNIDCGRPKHRQKLLSRRSKGEGGV